LTIDLRLELQVSCQLTELLFADLDWLFDFLNKKKGPNAPALKSREGSLSSPPFFYPRPLKGQKEIHVLST